MGRSLSQTAAGVSVLSPTANPSGVFGSGVIIPYSVSGTFVVPAGVTSVRVRCFGGGGGGAAEYTAGSTGGTSSFGAFVSATGGTGGGGRSYTRTEAGGTGVGGDINNTGGDGRSDNSGSARTHGGGSASYWGNGGAGGFVSSSQPINGGNGTGGAGGGGSVGTLGYVASGGTGFMSTGAIYGAFSSPQPYLAVPAMSPQGQGWSVDMYGTGGGGSSTVPGINGGGGGNTAPGAWPGGGSSGRYGSGGGGGFALEVIAVSPADSIAVTVGAGGAGGVNADPYTAPTGGGGLVIVEY